MKHSNKIILIAGTIIAYILDALVRIYYVCLLRAMQLYKILYKIFNFSILAVLLLGPGRAEAYHVSGVVAFTYTADESRTGNMKTSSRSFSQQYNVGVQNYLWDPRFLRFQAGVGYTVTTSSLSENKGLNYDLSMNFFPGMLISWDLYDRQSTSKVSTNENIAGYDLTTSSYGGSLNLNLSRRGGMRGNNNNNYDNNNNSNNNNGSRFHFPMPDITLSYGHIESDSPRTLNPINESRDNAGFSMRYRIKTRVDLNMDQTNEIYKNFITGGTYDTKTTTFASKILVSPDADLDVSGNRTDRTTAGLAGFGLHDTTWRSTVALNFKERDGIRHGYTYGFSKLHSDNADLTSHNAMATVSYRINSDLFLRGGLNYSLAEYITSATGTTAATSEQKQNMESGGAQTGVAYRKLYTPDFLGPFAMNTDYGFNMGYTTITSAQTSTSGDTNGLYYENAAGVGFTSKGWIKDSLFAGYNISSRRDRSPLNNNVRSQSFKLEASTFRIPQASLRANVSYIATESSVSQYIVFLNNAQNNSSIGSRALLYGVSALYSASPSLNIDAGASQGRTSNSIPSLSTLQPNTAAQVEQLAYIGAHYVNVITRNLVYRANARDEWRLSSRIKTETRNIDMGLDCRIRQVLVNFTYRWNELMPENGFTTYQQSYMVMLSRPF